MLDRPRMPAQRAEGGLNAQLFALGLLLRVTSPLLVGFPVPVISAGAALITVSGTSAPETVIDFTVPVGLGSLSTTGWTLLVRRSGSARRGLAVRVIVYPPHARDGRRVRCDGWIPGHAPGPRRPGHERLPPQAPSPASVLREAPHRHPAASRPGVGPGRRRARAG